MDTITLILIIGLAAQGLAFAALILAGPVYAWNDRWLDRTHRATAQISFCCHMDSCQAEILYSSSGSLLIFSTLKQGIPPFLLKQICVRVSNNDILW